MKKYCYFLVIIGIFLNNTSKTQAESTHLTAATLHYPPYEYSEDGTAKGLAIDIIKEIFKRIKPTKKVSFIFYPWARAVSQVKTGQNDILFNAGKNNARQKWGVYANSILILQKYAFFARKGANIRLTQELNGIHNYSVGIRRGYLYGSGSFRKALDDAQFKTVYETDSVEQSVQMLLAGRTDFFIADIIPTQYYLKIQGLSDKLEMVYTPDHKTLIILEWPTYLLFSKKTISSSFVSKVEAILNHMKQDGTYDRIYQNYLIPE
ncbi:transporter substrate-binding domain-containing protein [Endozoicomonas sp. SM1973]|uniref:Transporter substrate-binding domain-containing protein n=1 Tax=Spartinivicinus marinus TaxID=2994442 RepID=A0A853IM60_9GAMM|nr:transporter substrate-binding domain-containing protein [Spartinivicinus marinus]MCX4027490.1 transporter substrate-binding domain-containing protein [Spartinivicinus marinus]NYZ68866.1 transporter substrate-binding domain-containing protein [Spartinivicinus marinus]